MLARRHSDDSKLTTRRSAEGDLDALVALLKTLFSLEADFAFDEAKQRSGLLQLLRTPTAVVQVACAGDGRVVGMATCQTVISTAEGGPAGVVEDVVVDPECQGQGIGTALLSAIENWAVAAGIKRLQLLYDTANEPAIGFYEHRGWSRTQLACMRKYL